MKQISKQCKVININRYHIFMKRGILNNDDHAAGIILGLTHGLCSIPDNTTLYDCELFGDSIVFIVECTVDKYEKLKEVIEKRYPNLCEFVEV